ncbi:Serine/threonine-protein kinase [Rhizophlyctis rosea]|nr:Serine/threonine-protein kinase [Rhizophlyctis rosea]
MFAEILKGVEHLHSHGVAHRDIKPHNILLDRKGHVRLADFGASWRCGPRGWTDEHCGTTLYMAPEMLLRCTYYVMPTDFWALGVTLFKMVTGTYPYRDPENPKEDFEPFFDYIERSEVVYPSTLSPDAVDLIKKLLDKSPRHRATMEVVKKHPFLKKHWALLGYDPEEDASPSSIPSPGPTPSETTSQQSSTQSEADSKVVCKLFCKHCNAVVCTRGREFKMWSEPDDVVYSMEWTDPEEVPTGLELKDRHYVNCTENYEQGHMYMFLSWGVRPARPKPQAAQSQQQSQQQQHGVQRQDCSAGSETLCSTASPCAEQEHNDKTSFCSKTKSSSSSATATTLVPQAQPSNGDAATKTRTDDSELRETESAVEWSPSQSTATQESGVPLFTTAAEFATALSSIFDIGNIISLDAADASNEVTGDASGLQAYSTKCDWVYVCLEGVVWMFGGFVYEVRFYGVSFRLNITTFAMTKHASYSSSTSSTSSNSRCVVITTSTITKQAYPSSSSDSRPVGITTSAMTKQASSSSSSDSRPVGITTFAMTKQASSSSSNFRRVGITTSSMTKQASSSSSVESCRLRRDLLRREGSSSSTTAASARAYLIRAALPPYIFLFGGETSIIRRLLQPSFAPYPTVATLPLYTISFGDEILTPTSPVQSGSEHPPSEKPLDIDVGRDAAGAQSKKRSFWKHYQAKVKVAARKVATKVLGSGTGRAGLRALGRGVRRFVQRETFGGWGID